MKRQPERFHLTKSLANHEPAKGQFVASSAVMEHEAAVRTGAAARQFKLKLGPIYKGFRAYVSAKGRKLRGGGPLGFPRGQPNRVP